MGDAPGQGPALRPATGPRESAGRRSWLQFLLFSFCAASLPLTLSLSVSFLICLRRDRQVMEKKLKGKIQGKCK